MVVLIDNFDSFTYNLYQYIASLGETVIVLKNDTPLDEIIEHHPDIIILSPGPGNPDTAGVCLALMQYFYKKIPIFGICLGHQVIGQFFGGEIIKAQRPMHGKISPIQHDGQTIFSGIATPCSVVRYHSLVVNPDAIPTCLEVSALTAKGEIMGIRHKEYLIEGVQFHPESILSEQGKILLQNFFTHYKKQIIL